MQQLRALIQKGVPASGMPAFDLPADELDALAALVHSLKRARRGRAVARGCQAGEQFFFRQRAMHILSHGAGARGGCRPDLSDVGARLTGEEIRESLLQPGTRTAAGYELATVQLRDGHSLRGFIRSRSNFDLHLQDLQGNLSLSRERRGERIRDWRRIAHASAPSKPGRIEPT